MNSFKNYENITSKQRLQGFAIHNAKRLYFMKTIMSISENSITRLAWRVEEIARETGLSIQFLRKEIRNKNLKAKKKGRCVLVLEEDLRQYLIS